MGRRKCIIVIWGNITRVRDIWKSGHHHNELVMGLGRRGEIKEPGTVAKKPNYKLNG